MRVNHSRFRRRKNGQIDSRVRKTRSVDGLARCTGAGSDPRRGDAADWRHSAPALINLTLIKLAKPSSAAFRVSN